MIDNEWGRKPRKPRNDSPYQPTTKEPAFLKFAQSTSRFVLTPHNFVKLTARLEKQLRKFQVHEGAPALGRHATRIRGLFSSRLRRWHFWVVTMI
jgi:hypothetical protein